MANEALIATRDTSDGGAGSSRREHTAKPSHKGPALVGLMLAVLLVGLSLPRLIAAVLALGAESTLTDAHGGAAVTDADLASAGNLLAAANHWVSNGEIATDQSFLLLQQAMARPPGPERTRLLQQTEAVTRAGLSASPSQPVAWLRLAWLRKVMGDQTGALAALRLSWLSGSFDPGIMTTRLDFALNLLPVMDQEMKSLLSRQLRLAWVVAPDYVSGLSQRPELSALVQEALGNLSSDDVAHYLRLHGQRP